MTGNPGITSHPLMREIYPIAAPQSTVGAYKLVSDACSLVVSGHENLGFSEIQGDLELSRYILNGGSQLPFVIRGYDTRRDWNETHGNLRRMLRGADEQINNFLRLIHVTHAELRLAETASLHDVLMAAKAFCGKIRRYQGAIQNENVRGKLSAIYRTFDEELRVINERVPPLSVNFPMRFPHEIDPAGASSVLFIAESDSHAGLLFGWKGNINAGSDDAKRLREAILGGYVSAGLFTNQVPIKQGDIIGVPAYVPSGVIGGMRAFSVGAPRRSFPIDRFWGDGADLLWERLFEQMGKNGGEEIFATGMTPREKLECMIGESDKRHNSYTLQPEVDRMFSIDIGGVSAIRIPLKAGETFSSERKSIGDPIVWVMLGGGVSVTTPSQTTYTFSEGSAVLIPAGAQGLYTATPAADGGSVILSVGGPPSSRVLDGIRTLDRAAAMADHPSIGDEMRRAFEDEPGDPGVDFTD